MVLFTTCGSVLNIHTCELQGRLCHSLRWGSGLLLGALANKLIDELATRHQELVCHKAETENPCTCSPAVSPSPHYRRASRTSKRLTSPYEPKQICVLWSQLLMGTSRALICLPSALEWPPAFSICGRGTQAHSWVSGRPYLIEDGCWLPKSSTRDEAGWGCPNSIEGEFAAQWRRN